MSRRRRTPSSSEMVIETRAPTGTVRMLAGALGGELQSWSGVVAKPGESERTEGRLTNSIMMHRRKSAVGSFLYVRPKADYVRLDFRLPREYADGRTLSKAAVRRWPEAKTDRGWGHWTVPTGGQMLQGMA